MSRPALRARARPLAHFSGLAAALAIVTVAACPPARGDDPPREIDPELRALLGRAIAEAESFEDRFDAEVWLTDMSQRLADNVPNNGERITILKAVHTQAKRADLPPELVLAVIDVESNFDRFAISSASALGLMQVMPFWVDELGFDDKNQLFDIETNVLLGCQILRYYIDMEDGDFVQGLARYNGSTGKRWYADRVLDRLRREWYRL